MRASKIQRHNWKDKYPDTWSTTYKQDVIELGGVCSKCGCGNSHENPLQRDHIIALSKGGSNTKANLRLLCRNCHKLRHNRR